MRRSPSPALRSSLVLVLLCGFFGGPAYAAFAHEKLDVEIPMRDGKTLAAHVYLPSTTTGSWPTVLIQTPYSKGIWDVMFTNPFADDPLFKNPDYAFVVLDWRGFFESLPAFYFGAPSRGEDGFDAVQWIAAQPWSDGKVGMWGQSAMARAAIATAQEAPPALRAAALLVYNWRDGYDVYYTGGVYARNAGDFFLNSVLNPEGHPLPDPFWANLEENSGPVDGIDIPMLHVGGWYDHKTELVFAERDRVNSRGAAGAVGRSKMMIGPWAHNHVRDAEQGELEYPDAAFASSEASLELFDRYLRGIANGYEDHPTFRYYVMNEATWVGDATWPPPSSARTLHLRADGSLAASGPGAPGEQTSYPVDPQNPVPTLFGAVVNEVVTVQGPGDLSALEGRADVVSFTTPVLTEVLELRGHPVAHLAFTTDVIDTDLAVRLTQVFPEGRSMLLMDSIVRASLRNGFENRELLVPGTRYELEVELPSIAVTIPVGHQLRMLVAPSNWDRFDRNMQDGSLQSDDSDAVAVPGTVTLHLGSDAASWLSLPTRCVDDDGDDFSVSGGGCGPVDCDDIDSFVNPGAVEIPGNGLDDDCDPATPDEVSGCQSVVAPAPARPVPGPPATVPLATLFALAALTQRLRKRRL